jgi:hypothetical protein
MLRLTVLTLPLKLVKKLDCLTMTPFSLQKFCVIVQVRGWSPFVPLKPYPEGTMLSFEGLPPPSALPQTTTAEAPIHANSLREMVTFRLNADSMIALPSNLSKTQPSIVLSTTP